MTEINKYPWCRHGIDKSGYCAECKVASLITTIESQKEEIEKLRTKLEAKLVFVNNGNEDQRWYQQEQQTAQIESLQKENEQLRHRDRVVSLTNETLGRYVREGKEEIDRLKEKLKHSKLTPMEKMSEAMETISHIQEGDK
jgi:intein-encoded DNA endonuclease-like protein